MIQTIIIYYTIPTTLTLLADMLHKTPGMPQAQLISVTNVLTFLNPIWPYKLVSCLL